MEAAEAEVVQNNGVKVEVDKEDIIQAGRTVVLQKFNYLRTHLLNPKKNLQLGRDHVNLEAILGHKFGTTFQMISDHKNNKCFNLVVPDEVREAFEIENRSNLGH